MLSTVFEKQKKQSLFQLFFLKNDDNQSVEVAEVEEINFEEVKRRLEIGEDIFITRKREQKTEIDFLYFDLVNEPWYLLRS